MTAETGFEATTVAPKPQAWTMAAGTSSTSRSRCAPPGQCTPWSFRAGCPDRDGKVANSWVEPRRADSPLSVTVVQKVAACSNRSSGQSMNAQIQRIKSTSQSFVTANSPHGQAGFEPYDVLVTSQSAHPRGE